jgi:hypothetical protein
VVTIKIYIEGGGEGKDLDIRFREAWTKFFKSAGLAGHMPRPVRGKGRMNTFDLFPTAIKKSQPNELPLLLLDSEDGISTGKTVWQHLKDRDGFAMPNGATEKHAYLMVQVMETWLLADPESLQAYFGSKFKADKIPAWQELETQTKPNIYEVLEKATAACDKAYAKGKVSFEILGKLNPQKVIEKCPNAKRLLDFLAKKR